MQTKQIIVDGDTVGVAVSFHPTIVAYPPKLEIGDIINVVGVAEIKFGIEVKKVYVEGKGERYCSTEFLIPEANKFQITDIQEVETLHPRGFRYIKRIPTIKEI